MPTPDAAGNSKNIISQCPPCNITSWVRHRVSEKHIKCHCINDNSDKSAIRRSSLWIRPFFAYTHQVRNGWIHSRRWPPGKTLIGTSLESASASSPACEGETVLDRRCPYSVNKAYLVFTSSETCESQIMSCFDFISAISCKFSPIVT